MKGSARHQGSELERVTRERDVAVTMLSSHQRRVYLRVTGRISAESPVSNLPGSPEGSTEGERSDYAAALTLLEREASPVVAVRRPTGGGFGRRSVPAGM